MSRRKSKSRTTETATQKPIVPGYIQQPVTDYFGRVSQLIGGQGPSASAYGPSALQRQAFAGAGSLGPNASIDQAQGATRGLLNFTPDAVTAGQLSSTNLSPYMDPFQNDVIAGVMDNAEEARQRMITAGQGAATRAGAFGGSRHGVADAETNRSIARDLTSTIAGLRSANFGQARDAAMFDIGNRLGADTFNSTQGLAGANFRLGAANQLGQLGLTGDANSRANLGLQADLGAQERDVNMASDPATQQAMWLRQLQALLGLSPEALIGQQRDGTSTNRSSQSGMSFGFNWGPFSVGG